MCSGTHLLSNASMNECAYACANMTVCTNLSKAEAACTEEEHTCSIESDRGLEGSTSHMSHACTWGWQILNVTTGFKMEGSAVTAAIYAVDGRATTATAASPNTLGSKQ